MIQDVLKKTSDILSPTPSHVSPIPTVVPNPIEYEYVGKAGGTALWIVFIIMLLSTFAFIAMAARVPANKRLFHSITATITLTAAISYFAMATGDGNAPTTILIKEAHKHVPDTYTTVIRQIFYARYIDWAITTPFLLLDLCFLAGLSGADIYTAIVADLVMVMTGLFATFGSTEGQKWGYYAMACVAYIAIVWVVALGGRRTASGKNAATGKFFAAIGGFTFILWTLYPVVWGFGDGARILTVDGEIIAYAILDVLAKPVFGFWLLITHANSTAESIEGFWTNGLSSDGGLRLDEDEGA